MLAREIAERQPHVVGLQEVYDQAALQALGADYIEVARIQNIADQQDLTIQGGR